MSTFLALNGHRIPCRVGFSEGSYDRAGELVRADDGTLLDGRRYRREVWDLRTPLVSAAEAEAIKGLVDGLGHYWSFDDDLFSSKGLGPTDASDATQNNSGGKFGGRVIIGSGKALEYEAGLFNDWTVLVYRFESSAWVYYAVRSDGAKWVDGTRNDGASTAWLVVDTDDGTVTLQGEADYDELAALPYLATADMIEDFQALDVRFSSLPRLNATGGLIPVDNLEVMGEVEPSAVRVAGIDNTLEIAAESVEFVLRRAR